MKCPRCGADSEVLDTREAPHLAMRRRRQCFNNHRFTTLEVHPQALNSRDLGAAAVTVFARVNRWVRDRLIRNDPRTSTLVARDHNLTEARVRQIRQGTR